MEKIKEQAVTRLRDLNEIKPKIYTALELHPQRQMLGRVQRREEVRYLQGIQKQKVKLQEDIAKIDAYLGSVRMQEEYRARRGNGRNGSIPKVLPAPNIVFGPKPRMVETRLTRERRRGKF